MCSGASGDGSVGLVSFRSRWTIQALLVREQRRTFRVLGRSSSPFSPACPGGNGNDDGLDEQNRHDDKGKDPLQGNDLAQELGNANGRGQDAEGETHGEVLVNGDEERAKAKNRPDENVAKDPSDQVGRVVHHDGAVPVNGNECPGQRRRHGGRMDESRVRVVAEVERGQVDKVEDEHDLGPEEVGADKEHDPSKVEKVVDDEVAPNAGRGVDMLGALGEEVGDVAELEDKERNPEDVGNDAVHGEGARVESVLIPDAPAESEAIVRLVGGVVDRRDDGQDPGEDGEDLVGDDGVCAVRLPLGEGVILVPLSHDCL
jgi:hypothetical protein